MEKIQHLKKDTSRRIAHSSSYEEESDQLAVGLEFQYGLLICAAVMQRNSNVAFS